MVFSLQSAEKYLSGKPTAFNKQREVLKPAKNSIYVEYLCKVEPPPLVWSLIR